ncbi:MAG TPA: nucleotidyl transferase AbiEii/AbiGii toxin family protein [Pyrinomonadaceae bacterium]|nr:nucleotidyl transferase AbiEii/AbiGii toxin family protein [Pyrinomonadaceae bacterium]
MADPNTELLNAVVNKLGTFADEFVFLGGSTIGLYITDPGSASIRPTKDVDGIVQAATYAEYVRVEERIASLGFTRVQDPICRWEIDGLLLDVLPVDGSFLGFRSRWFSKAFDASQTLNIAPGLNIRVANPAYLIATKLEAFNDRGNKDFLASRDLEDILALVNGREELIVEISSSEAVVSEFIRSAFSSLLDEQGFLESIPGHLNPEPERATIVIGRLREISRI